MSLNSVCVCVSGTVEIKSFEPSTLELAVIGKRAPTESGLSSSWRSMLRYWRGGVEVGADTVNIFSLASGHMYERLLRIMVLSVHRNTQRKLKFWILDNFLSDKFREKADALSAK